ncbi:MAG TPA: trehalose-6-phosphate synthase [Thermoanaerobaculia bacterium]|nr:trehalose-6-phosphate synthase [Thermoanaerobaculia bacterium]
MNLVVVSNRLPFALTREDGAWRVEPGSGGLVTALRPVLEGRGGRWIGWSGAVAEDLPDARAALRASGERFGYELVPVPLTASERDRFYHGFSNEVIWPLFHDLLSMCRFDPEYWRAYEAVNRRFAAEAAKDARPGDFFWVHDYHLLAMAGELRRLGVSSRIAFFLHIPFPPLDVFLKLPWRFPVLQSLLSYDLVGFQTIRDRRNFLQCVRLLLPGARFSGKGAVMSVRWEDRDVRVGTFPISIDARALERRARQPEVVAKAASLRADETGRRIVLGVDRLDYTKGIAQKLEAFRRLLETSPELRGNVTLVQIAVPSREEIRGYREHRTAIERLVGEINGTFTRSGWVPVHYLHRPLEGPRLSAYYLAADVALVTPLKDGMNLVAKEYCATRVSKDGVLVLSEFAGAAAELQRAALLVNPYDVEGVADALRRALDMPRAEQRARMSRLRRTIRERDIYHWLDAFLRAAISRDLAEFPRVADYLPTAIAS